MWTILLLSVVPLSEVSFDSVDLIEHNHFYDERGAHVFDQIIYYEWCCDTSSFMIIDWRLVKPTNIGIIPQKSDVYSSIWFDSYTIRKIRSKSYVETWTQYDPELLHRSILPKDDRAELSTKISKARAEELINRTNLKIERLYRLEEQAP